MPRQGASYSSASSSGGKKQKNSSYQKKKRMTGVSAPVGDEDIDQDDLEDALMVNREYQEQLRLTYFHLEDVKRRLGRAIGNALYENTNDDVFFGNRVNGIVTNEPRQAPPTRFRNFPAASRYRRAVGEEYFVDHTGKSPGANVVTRARQHIRNQLPPNFGSSVMWKPTDDALVKEGVNQIGKLSEEESNRTGASVHGENRDAASEVSSDEEQSNKKAKKYNQPKDLLKIRSSTAFRKLRLETERINSTYRPADIDKVDWKKIARKFLPRMTPEDCKVRWCYHLDPNINRDPFTAEEKRKLSDLLRNPRNLCRWEQVAEELGTNRHPFDCLKLHNRNEFRQSSKWSTEEEAKLKELVAQYISGYHEVHEGILAKIRSIEDPSERPARTMPENETTYDAIASDPEKSGLLHGSRDSLITFCGSKGGAAPGVGVDADLDHDWSLFSDHLPLKSSSETRRRWTQVADPTIDRSRFSEEEDRKLLLLQRIYGKSWISVARHLPSRTAQQVREHYENVVNVDRNTALWTEEEDQALIEAVEAVGLRKWTGVARHMRENKGFIRDDAQCLKRFSSLRYQNPALTQAGFQGSGDQPRSSSSSSYRRVGRQQSGETTAQMVPELGFDIPSNINYSTTELGFDEDETAGNIFAEEDGTTKKSKKSKRSKSKSKSASRKRSKKSASSHDVTDTAASAARVASELARKENVRYVESSEARTTASYRQSSAHLKRGAQSATVPGVGVRLEKSKRRSGRQK